MKNLIAGILLLAGFTMNAQDFPPPPEVMLLGKHTFEELRTSTDENYKWFMENAALADTNSCNECREILSKKKFKMVVVGGTWCDDTKSLLPAFYDIMSASVADIDKVVDLYFVDREKATPAEVVIKYEVKNIPVFIVYDKDGIEVGRIVESLKTTRIQDDLLEIIRKLK